MSFWKKLFGKKEEREERVLDPFTDVILEKMQAGWLVDFDGRTWEVVSRHYHDFGDGYRAEEWELRCDGDLRYLNREEEDGVYWTWTRKVPIGAIDEHLRSHIQSHGDPPETVEFEGIRYFLRSYGGAKFFKNGMGPAKPFLFWDYEDESGDFILTIEQWGDIEFEAFVGRYVEEYQFINILPNTRR